jgi:hypothetical protein
VRITLVPRSWPGTSAAYHVSQVERSVLVPVRRSSARVCAFGEVVRSTGQPEMGTLTRGLTRALRRNSLPVLRGRESTVRWYPVHPDSHAGDPMILVRTVCVGTNHPSTATGGRLHVCNRIRHNLVVATHCRFRIATCGSYVSVTLVTEMVDTPLASQRGTSAEPGLVGGGRGRLRCAGAKPAVWLAGPRPAART